MKTLPGYKEAEQMLTSQFLLERKTERQRWVIIHKLAGYNQTEIAESMGVCQKTVSNILDNIRCNCY